MEFEIYIHYSDWETRKVLLAPNHKDFYAWAFWRGYVVRGKEDVEKRASEFVAWYIVTYCYCDLDCQFEYKVVWP